MAERRTRAASPGATVTKKDADDKKDGNVKKELEKKEVPSSSIHKDLAVTALLVVGWYVSSMMAITTSKLAMQMMKAPLFLCSVQFFTATTVSGLITVASGQPKALLGAEMPLLLSTSLTYTAGFWFTNLAFSLAAASFVETVKSGEPITTVILAFILLGEVESVSTYAALVPVVIGVGMASAGVGGGLVAFIATIGSNLGFSARAVFAKNLKRDHPKSPCALSDSCLFFYISLTGLLALVPFAAFTERHIVQEAMAAGDFDYNYFAKVFLINGTMYTAYNQLSFMVLSRVTTASHAVLNVFRRVCVIGATTMFFGTPLTSVNMAGIVLALIGMVLFTRFKTAKATPAKKAT